MSENGGIKVDIPNIIQEEEVVEKVKKIKTFIETRKRKQERIKW